MSWRLYYILENSGNYNSFKLRHKTSQHLIQSWPTVNPKPLLLKPKPPTLDPTCSGKDLPFFRTPYYVFYIWYLKKLGLFGYMQP